MADPLADRELLFAVLAFRMDFITRDQLVAAVDAWGRGEGRSIGQILVENGSLDPTSHDLLKPMVAAHAERHGGDPSISLATLVPAASMAAPLTRASDPDLTDSQTRVGPGPRRPDSPPSPWAVDGPRFEVLRPHARGGIGVVFVAHDRELNREVALKEIQGRHADEPTSRARFLMEAEVTGGLEHPGIVPVYGLGHYPDGRLYYAMRFIRGESLKDAIGRFREGDWSGAATRALALRKLLRSFLDVCDAVAYAHSRGVIHRDLKPANIMLGKHGETLVVDWGLAKSIDRPDPAARSDERPFEPSSASGSAETLPGSTIGTPAYMSPEQAAGDLDRLGPASDVYSLGATLYHVLTGQPPFDGRDIARVLQQVRDGDFPPPRLVDRDVDVHLDAICRKAMAREAGDRYPSTLALADDLERWMADEPVSAYREPALARLARWSRRHRTLVISATALVLTISSGSAWIYKERLERRTAEAEHLAAKKEAERAIEVARFREYQEYLGRAREDRRDGRAGWTWAARESLGRAAGLDSSARDPVELRTEAVAGLGEVDLLPNPKTLAPEMTAHCLAFSPDGRRLAVAQSKAQAFTVCSVKVFDAATLEEVKSLTFNPPLRWLISKSVQDGARVVAFGPDGRLAVGARSGWIHCWDLTPATPSLVSWDAHAEAVTGLAFSPDGKTLYSGSIDRTLKRWDLSGPLTKAPRVARAFRSPGRIESLSLDAAGRTLAASDEGSVLVLDPETLEPKRHSIASGGRVALSPDGRTLAVDRGGSIDLVSPEGDFTIARIQEARANEAPGPRLSGLAFSPDGAILAATCSAEEERGVKLWDVASGRSLSSLNIGGTGDLEATFRPDGRALAAIGERGAWVADLGGPDIRQTVAVRARPLLAIDLAPDGRMLACLSGTEARGAATTDVVLDLSDLVGGPQPIRRATIPGVRKPHELAFDRSGRLLAFRGSQDRVEFWGLGGLASPGPLAVGPLSSFEPSPDGARLWGIADDQVTSYALADGALKSRWSNWSAQVVSGLSGLTCLATGRAWVLAGGRDGLVRLLRAGDGQPESAWNPGQGPIRSVALSPDDTFAAAGSQAGGVSLYRRATGERVASWTAHAGAVTSLAFSDDGRLLAAGSADRIVRLWRREGEAWGELMTLPAASGPIRAVRFGSGGKGLAVLVDGERAVRLWHLDRVRQKLAPLGLDWSD